MSKQLAVYLSMGYRWGLMAASIGIFTLFLKSGFSWGKVIIASALSLGLSLAVAIPVEMYIWREFELPTLLGARVDAFKQQYKEFRQYLRNRK